ncbi:metallophosphoesterase [Acinetobacter baumannii]
MKVAYCSDLHLHGTLNYPDLDNKECADVLILAGDILVYSHIEKHLEFINRVSKQYKHIIYVEGNHEWYGGDLYRGKPLFDTFMPDNVVLLRNNSYTIDGVSFYGGTLWSNITESPNKNIITDMVNCFKMVRADGKLLNPDICKELYDDFLEGLYEYEYRNDNKKVVISHFPPSKKSINPSFKDWATNDFFCNDLDMQISHSEINYWICGHVHHEHEYSIGETKILCNPRGYAREMNNFKLKYFEI